MALSATCVGEARFGEGDDDNSGLFNPKGTNPGTDYTQQNNAEVVIDGVTITATVHSTTTQINIVGIAVTAAWNRNTIKFTGGTLTLTTREITAVDTVNNRITVDASAGTAGQTGTGRMGGAKRSIGEIARLGTGGNTGVVGIVWWCRGTDVLTSATPQVPGGIWTGSTGQWRLFGYYQTRGDLNAVSASPNRPTIDAGALTGITMVSSTSSTVLFVNFIFDGKGNATVNGVVSAWLIGCRIRRCVTALTLSSSTPKAFFCEIDGNTTGVAQGICISCYLHDNGTAFSGAEGAVNCIFANQTVNDSTGSPANVFFVNCTFYGTDADSMNNQNGTREIFINCVWVEITGDVFDWGAAAGVELFIGINVATYNIGSLFETAVGTPAANRYNQIALSGDPFTNAAGGDFSPDSTSGEGAALDNEGLPIPGQLAGYIGAVSKSVGSGVNRPVRRQAI